MILSGFFSELRILVEIFTWSCWKTYRHRGQISCYDWL